MLAELDSSDFELLECRCTPNKTELIKSKKANEHLRHYLWSLQNNVEVQKITLYVFLVKSLCLKRNKKYILNDNIADKIRDEIKSRKIRKTSDYKEPQKTFY